MAVALFFGHLPHVIQRPLPLERGRIFERASNSIPQSEILSIVVVKEHVVVCVVS